MDLKKLLFSVEHFNLLEEVSHISKEAVNDSFNSHNITQSKCPSTPLEHAITFDHLSEAAGCGAEAGNLSYPTLVPTAASLSPTSRVAYGRLKLKGCIIHVGLWLRSTSPINGATETSQKTRLSICIQCFPPK